MLRWTSMVLLWVAAAGCTVEHDVSITIALAEETRGRATAFELSVVPGAACPDVSAVITGATSPIHTQSWRTGDLPASVGRLDEGDWSFSVVVRDSECAPIAFGCQSITVGSDERVSVRPAPLTWAAPVCPTGQICGGGLCAPGACAMDCAAMGGMCCSGSCVNAAIDRENCGSCGRRCTDSEMCFEGECVGCEPGMTGPDECTCRIDPERCSCDHVCPTDLRCIDGLCRPELPMGSSVRLEGVEDTTCALFAAVLWLPIGERGPMPSGATVAYSLPLSDRGFVVPIMASDSPPADTCPDGSCIAGLAFAAIVVVLDQNGDKAIDDAEARARVGVFGVAPTLLVWSNRDRPPTDPDLVRLQESWSLHFAEGTLAGLAAYRTDTDDTGGMRIVPDGRSEILDRIDLCYAASCTEGLEGDACSTMQPRPFGIQVF